MKKFLAILLAMMLVLVNVAALAELDPPADEGTDTEPATATEDANILKDQNPTKAAEYQSENPDDPNNGKFIGNATAPFSVTLTKAYTVTGDTAVMPGHTLTFAVTQVDVEENQYAEFPEGKVTITPVVVPAETADGATLDLVINLPAYDKTGVYNYTFVEEDGSELTTPHTVAGVQYNTKTYELKVTVVQGEALAIGGIDATGLVVAGVALREQGSTGKIDTVDNEYIAGSLVIDKQVTGNLGDRKLPFSFKVTFTTETNEYVDAPIAYTQTTYDDEGNRTTEDKTIEAGWTGSKVVEFNLIHGDSITFTNIPEGVTYTAEETEGFDYKKSDSGNLRATIADESEIAVTFTNDKTAEIDTGVELETLPFVLLMGIALVGVMALRRREEY